MKRSRALTSHLLACILTVSTWNTSAAPHTDRLSNLSSRARAGSGPRSLVAGFIVGEGPPKQVLIRAIGPSLAQFGLYAPLPKPKLELYDNRGVKLLENTSWMTPGSLAPSVAAAFESVGAFPLAGGDDAAVLVTLSAGSYTAVVSGADGREGVALVEVYDVSGPAQLMNLSTRAEVRAGAEIVISGLVISPGSD
ncbi:MAG TPA: hypothetical protein PLV87_01540, partial [Opitutaceae bacterium]|nr:hypothetical protein [Opitutaceae bacterium]